MTNRDRLIELFKKIEYTPFPEMTMKSNLGNQFTDYALNCIVDELLANGVKLPVMCKDCKHFKPLSDGSWINQNREDGICYALVNYHDSERYCVQPDHFCSYGELKECEG